MDEISIEFKISKITVARRLKERNILFKAYVNEQRIEKAKEIMRNNPNKMIKDIAFETGFVNVVSFNRLFKKYELISPKQYQDNLKRK
ncbi:MAG: helix-turn-helix domain-containing protein [Clostridia bacterium]|nr:helix-turn-helix domain-containing protein [Clostridia bacterium]